MPELLSSWELVEQLAASEWALLFRARPAGSPADTPCDYVVKTARPDSHATALRFLAREALACRTVSHAHVVSVLAMHLKTAPPWLVMPYLGSTNLATRLDQPSTWSLRQSVWVARQTAEGLAALHTAGWLHGDVKPENIMVGPEGHATLIDLGFARRLGTRECAAGSPLLGTPSFAAPERLDESSPVTAAADIYSLGVTLRQMLDLLPPARRDDSWPHAGPSPEAATRQLVEQMLQRDPLRRPTAPQVRDALTGMELSLLASGATGNVA